MSKATIVHAVICSDSDRVAYDLRPASNTMRKKSFASETEPN